MTVQWSAAYGLDDTLPAPPLVAAPLSLLDESTDLVDLERLVATRQQAVERLASVQAQLSAYGGGGPEGGGENIPGEAGATADAIAALEQEHAEWTTTLESLDTTLKDQQRFEHGFLYLPEQSNSEALTP